jgi:hypothetical protein
MRKFNLAATAAAVVLAGTFLPIGIAGAEGLNDHSTKGFLSSYEGLAPLGDGSDAYLYQSPKDKSKYEKVMIDRIKIFLKDDADYKGIDPTELKELADYLHDAIVTAVGDAYPVVDEAGPDVVRLRIAVTDVVPNKPEASVVTLVVPFLWVGEAGSGVAEGKTGSTPFVGESSVQMEALDSVSSEQLGAYIDSRVAKKYNWTHGAVEGATDYLHAYSTWAYTKQAMDGWAQFVRERLDAAHGKVAKAN